MNWFSHIATWITTLFVVLGFHAAPIPPNIPIAVPTTSPGVACTMEARQCPDGSWVGRVPPSCEFAPCPSASSTATSTKPAPAPKKAPRILSLQPLEGAIGETVTVHGSGFTADNTVDFGSGAIVHVASSDGVTLTFDVPGSLNPRCYYSTPRCLIASRVTSAGTYAVQVQNQNGTSNAVQFSVTGAVPATSVSIYSITPSQGPVGTIVTIDGYGFTSDNTIHFGAGAIPHVAISSRVMIACTTDPNCKGGMHERLTFTVPSSIGPYCPPGSMCPMFLQKITDGSYDVYVQNGNGASKTVTFDVSGQ